jgi:hypothetical protein
MKGVGKDYDITYTKHLKDNPVFIKNKHTINPAFIRGEKTSVGNLINVASGVMKRFNASSYLI